jgi:hypothetical protein
MDFNYYLPSVLLNIVVDTDEMLPNAISLAPRSQFAIIHGLFYDWHFVGFFHLECGSHQA